MRALKIETKDYEELVFKWAVGYCPKGATVTGAEFTTEEEGCCNQYARAVIEVTYTLPPKGKKIKPSRHSKYIGIGFDSVSSIVQAIMEG